MRSFVILALALFLTLAGAAGVGLLLPACGVRLPLLGQLGRCTDPGAVAAEDRLHALVAANAGLARQIASLEREIGAMQCTRRAALPELPELPDPAIPPAGIDADGWNTGDLGVLDGCWSLDSHFQTTNDQTGVTSRYTTWEMCFGPDGRGTERMLADNGTSCSGPVSGTFDGTGALVIEEPGNLQCSDGGFIFRLSSRCTPDPDGTAHCVVRQPEVSRSANVIFRRASGNQ